MTHRALRLRPITGDDSNRCARLLLKAHPGAELPQSQLSTTLRELVKREAVKGMLIEDCLPGSADWTASGLGLSGFVTSARVDAHLAEPAPFLFLRLLREAAAQNFLLPPDIALGNSGDGLDLVLHYTQGNWDLTDPHWLAVCTLAHEAYVRDHRGYRLRRALQEDWSREPDIYVATGYRAFTHFDVAPPLPDPSDPARKPQRVLYYASAEEVRGNPPGSTIVNVFQYVPPRCGFSAAEQRILSHAMTGATDEVIAAALGLSLNSIKQAWRRIYDRVGEHASFVFSPDEPVLLATSSRGPEKRRRVLAFIDGHPQEVRPHAKIGSSRRKL